MTLTNKKNGGFSLVELMIAMTIMLILMGVVSMLMSRSFGVRARESRRTDALTSAQAALNVLSREISNAGFGIYDNQLTRRPNNGLILADCNENKLRFRTNFSNNNSSTNSAGEDVTFFFDSATSSIVRYDPNGSPQTSVIVNRISNVSYLYYQYTGANSTPTTSTTPTADTGRVRITVSVTLDPVQGQPNNQTVTFSSEVTLRNSSYMLNQY